jgi:hypothetical protein
MTKSILVTYEEADESFLLTLLNKIKVKTTILDPEMEEKRAFKAKKTTLDELNRLEILAATKELENKIFTEISQEDLHHLITN